MQKWPNGFFLAFKFQIDALHQILALCPRYPNALKWSIMQSKKEQGAFLNLLIIYETSRRKSVMRNHHCLLVVLLFHHFWNKWMPNDTRQLRPNHGQNANAFAKNHSVFIWQLLILLLWKQSAFLITTTEYLTRSMRELVNKCWQRKACIWLLLDLWLLLLALSWLLGGGEKPNNILVCFFYQMSA